MSVFDKLRRDAGRPVTDPSDHRLFSGTIDDQRQARREYARHSRIRRIVKSGRDEIPRAELTPIRHGMLEHEATGNWYRPFGGDPDFGTADHISAYTMTETGDALLLENAGSRHEFEEKLAAKKACRAAASRRTAFDDASRRMAISSGDRPAAGRCAGQSGYPSGATSSSAAAMTSYRRPLPRVQRTASLARRNCEP